MAKKAAAPESYEELRRRNVEQNKKKLADLQLSRLSVGLQQSISPKSSPAKSRKHKIKSEETEFIVVRRSDRVAKLPGTNYKEIGVPEVMERRRRSSTKRRDLDGRVYASDEARGYATEKAEEIASQIEQEFPSFVKPMTQSHVTGGFWLGLPKHFCSKHLPKRDSPVTLVNENGEESETLYLYHKNGLSAGWRGFAIDHELVDGDALVFQLIKPATFKVHIVRASEYDAGQ